MSNSTDTDASAQSRLSRLIDDFTKGVPRRMAEISAHWSEFCDTGLETARNDTCISLHRLAGSGAMFNMPRVGDAARNAELAVDALPNSRPTPAMRAHVESLLEALRLAVLQKVPAGKVQTHAATSPGSEHQPHLLIFEPDTGPRQRLEHDLSHFGFRVTSTGEPGDLGSLLVQARYDAIVANVEFSGDPSAALSILAAKDTPAVGVPLVFLSEHDNFPARLAAVRAGGTAFLNKPVDIDQLIRLLDDCTQTDPADAYKVLVVDDDPQIAELTRLALEQARFTVATANTCERAMTLVKRLEPDVLVSDIHMPGCSGSELARILRQIEGLEAMPIIFFSAESTGDAQREAVLMGGDDFFTKSSDQGALVNACRYRAMRYRMIKNLMVRDSLTGLFNHAHTRTTLDSEFQQARRHGYPLCYAMLDLDHFKSVNDRYGHAFGDQILRSLARYLLHRLRTGDTVGRYGGEEFAIILPYTSRQAANKVLNALRTGFAEITHLAEGEILHQTCSIGFAMAEDYGTPQSFVEAADQALYQAKDAGRDRVCSATGESDHGKPS